jgi:hypothetical protein
MTFLTPTSTLKFEVKPTTNGGYTVEVKAASPVNPLGCLGRVPGSRPGAARKNWNLDGE